LQTLVTTEMEDWMWQLAECWCEWVIINEPLQGEARV